MNYPLSNSRRLLAVTLGLASTVPLSAETLAEYTFGTSSSNSGATTTGANVTPGAFARGGGLSSWTFSTAAGAPSPRSLFVTSAQVDEDSSATSNDWLGFTISATASNTLKLSDLSFYYAYTNTSGSIAGTAFFDVRSSVDDYATSIDLFSQAVVNSTTPDWQQASIGLSAMGYQNLDSISFRIFLNDGENTSTESQLRIDTVVLTGISDATTVIPEPSAAAVLTGLIGLGLAASRRRGDRLA